MDLEKICETHSYCIQRRTLRYLMYISHFYYDDSCHNSQFIEYICMYIWFCRWTKSIYRKFLYICTHFIGTFYLKRKCDVCVRINVCNKTWCFAKHRQNSHNWQIYISYHYFNDPKQRISSPPRWYRKMNKKNPKKYRIIIIVHSLFVHPHDDTPENNL